MVESATHLEEIPVDTARSRVWSGEFELLGVTLHVHVLDDGTRIIEADDMARFFRRMADDGPIRLDEAAVAEFAKWSHGRGVPGDG